MIQIDSEFIPRKKGIYLVGGSLRDCLLGRAPVDYDIVVLKNAEKCAEKIANQVNSRPFVIGRKDQAVYRVVSQDRTYDISLIKGASIEEDLAKRDFSINALAYETHSGNIIDVIGGLIDLRDRRIRMVSDTVFKADSVRLLRAYRIAAALGFRIEPPTLSAIRKDAHLIHDAPGERIRSELFDILENDYAHGIVEQMAETRLLFHFLPELEPLIGLRQNRCHEFDVFHHSINTLQHIETLTNDISTLLPENVADLDRINNPHHRAILKLSALLHDIGKPSSLGVDGKGNVRFIGHALAGSEMAAEIGKRLRLSNKEMTHLISIIRHHMRPLSLFQAHKKRTLTKRGIARFFMKTDAFALDILFHAVADTRAKKGSAKAKDQVFEQFLFGMMHDHATTFRTILRKKPLISGNDLIRHLNLAPSPLFKTILTEVKTHHLAGKIRSKKEALQLAKKIAGR